MGTITDVFLWFHEQATQADTWQQVLILIGAGAIPFIESYLGSFLGVLVGINPFIAVPAAVLGNIISTFLVITIAARTRTAVVNRRGSTQDAPRELTSRQQKVGRYLERFGVPGVCLLGPIVLASQITAPALIAAGARPRAVYLWQAFAITAWGILFGFFGELAFQWLY